MFDDVIERIEISYLTRKSKLGMSSTRNCSFTWTISKQN